jgi:hypothetical protein
MEVRTKIKVPQWIPTVLLVLLVPVIGYLAFSYIRDTQSRATASAQTDTDAQMISYLRQQYEAQYQRAGFHWTIQRRDGDNRLVCYCDPKGYGWWYQVQMTADGQFTATKVADTSAATIK